MHTNALSPMNILRQEHQKLIDKGYVLVGVIEDLGSWNSPEFHYEKGQVTLLNWPQIYTFKEAHHKRFFDHVRTRYRKHEPGILASSKLYIQDHKNVLDKDSNKELLQRLNRPYFRAFIYDVFPHRYQYEIPAEHLETYLYLAHGIARHKTSQIMNEDVGVYIKEYVYKKVDCSTTWTPVWEHYWENGDASFERYYDDLTNAYHP